MKAKEKAMKYWDKENSEFILPNEEENPRYAVEKAIDIAIQETKKEIKENLHKLENKKSNWNETRFDRAKFNEFWEKALKEESE